MTNKNNYLEDFYNSKGFSDWSDKNPNASAELTSSLDQFVTKHTQTPGFMKTMKFLSTNGKEEWGEWWNYYSEIRCAKYLEEKITEVQEFNHKQNGSDVDILLEDAKRWDVVSFGAKNHDVDHEAISDTKTIWNLYRKIEPKFSKQKADFVVCDDIFSARSNNFPLTWYFFEQAYTTRKKEFEAIFGDLIHKVLVLSFRKDMFNNPDVVFVGKEISFD